jgi:hypothetical protein
VPPEIEAALEPDPACVAPKILDIFYAFIVCFTRL